MKGPNLVLKYDSASGSLKNIAVPGSPYEALMDTPGNAIGVAACDLDGDGREEIYFLNTNQVILSLSSYYVLTPTQKKPGSLIK